MGEQSTVGMITEGTGCIVNSKRRLMHRQCSNELLEMPEESPTETSEEPPTETSEEPPTKTSEEPPTKTSEEPPTETSEEPTTETLEKETQKPDEPDNTFMITVGVGCHIAGVAYLLYNYEKVSLS